MCARDGLEEIAYHLGIERKAQAGNWIQHRPELFAQPGELLWRECREFITHIAQPLLMRDLPGHLHGEAKILRHALGPARIRRRAVRPVERRIDLDRVEGDVSVIAREMARARIEQVAVFAPRMLQPATPMRSVMPSSPRGPAHATRLHPSSNARRARATAISRRVWGRWPAPADQTPRVARQICARRPGW